MKQRFVVTDFTPTPDFDAVRRRLALTDGEDIAELSALYDEAVALARPKAVYRICFVERIDGDRVTIDGTEFRSAALAQNLRDIHRVFAYVLTCGTELDDWSKRCSGGDAVLAVWLDQIKELLLKEARVDFFERLKAQYGIEKHATMNPGSGNADLFPIEQQTQLFSLIGDVQADTGVTLTDSMLMLPTKSVSGILFPSDRGYVNCALCTRENCIGRKAPYEPDILTRPARTTAE